MGECLVKLQEAGIYVEKDGRIFRKGKQLKTFVKSNGYHAIRMSIDNKVRSYHVHRLVALFHIGEVGELTINHIDMNRSNNHVDNLEIVTLKKNIRLAIGNPAVSMRRGAGKFYPSIRCAEEDGFDASTICKVMKGKIKHHRGYTWAYV